MAKSILLPPLALVREVLHYDPVSGIFMWRRPAGGPITVGSRAGCLCGNRYRYIRIQGISYREHRLAWLYVNEEDPGEFQVDHIDNVRHHNWIDNLRLATHSQNQRNGSLRPSNTSGVKGVHWNKWRKKWHALITVDNKQIYLGLYESLEQAEAVVRAARIKLHGRFARHE